MTYQEHAHRKLRQAFGAILQQFSSNGNRKSMLSANRSFQAQKSTSSTLLQTCIVLSRKYLWDVNRDFWHQWRSLVITTLSARAIYRQIPVSYLQTWYTVQSSRLTVRMVFRLYIFLLSSLTLSHILILFVNPSLSTYSLTSLLSACRLLQYIHIFLHLHIT